MQKQSNNNNNNPNKTLFEGYERETKLVWVEGEVQSWWKKGRYNSKKLLSDQQASLLE